MDPDPSSRPPAPDRPSAPGGPRPWDRDGTDLIGWLLAPVGLVLVGAGLSVSVDAALRRAAGAPARRWVGQGTAGLVVLNSGLSVFGDAVRRRSAVPVGAEQGLDVRGR